MRDPGHARCCSCVDFAGSRGGCGFPTGALPQLTPRREMIELTGNNVVLVGIVAVIGLAALVVAGILVREVLAASEGTERMKEIGGWLGGGALLLVIGLLWGQRRASRAALARSRDMDKRRRKRREASASSSP